MRINISNAVSFTVVNELSLGKLWNNGLDKAKYKLGESNTIVRKAHIEVDFGTFKRDLCFDTQEQMENFISEYLPRDIDGCEITTP